MAKLTILGRGLDQDDIEALQILLADTGACEGAVEVVESVSDAQPVDDLAIVVVLGTPGTCADTHLETELINAQNAGQSVVWIWPEGSSESELPVTAKKYCYSVVAWNSKALTSVIADDDVVCFETPTGAPLDSVETDRNCCVEDGRVKPK